MVRRFERWATRGLLMVFAGLLAGCASSSPSTSNNQTAAPVFSPGGGTYTASQTVTISSPTSGALLYCTTDGTTPTTSSSQCAEPTTVYQTEFLQAIAVAPGMTASSVASAGYVINLKAAPTPTFTPGGGTYTGTQQVAISDTLAGANVYYTLDGSTPTQNSPLYTGPVAITKTETLNAIAFATGYTNSGMASASYTIQPAIPAPTITSLAPTSAVSGGAAFTLTVNGTNFVSGASVLWNGTALTTTYGNATTLTAAVPASLIASAGTANVTVVISGGVSSASTFTISAATPTVTSVAPSTGPAGTSVTIAGTNFTGVTSVKFGATAATSFMATSATSITATAPASTGAVDVQVVTATGTSATSAADQFTYTVLTPTVSSVSPSNGGTMGGTSVTITGTNFTSATAVSFGATPATSFTVKSATSITAISPAGSAGTVDVKVVTSAGTSATSAADQFTYAVLAPTVTSVAPSNGGTSGGTSVTITGTNFTGATAVTFGATAATSFTVTSSTSITAASPVGTAGSVDVTVTTPGGTSATSAADQFTYNLSAPAVSVLSPTTGAIGATVTITGTNFGASQGSSTVTFSGVAATITSWSNTSIMTFVPQGAATGAVEVTVGGLSSNGQTFTIPLPTVTSLSPNSGASTGATPVTIAGSNFTGATAVNFGTTPATSFTVTSATTITATSPAGTGTVHVTVVTPDGTSVTIAADQFTYGTPLNGTVATTAAGSAVAVVSTVQLYAAGTTGYGEAPTTIGSPVQTDKNGKFTVLYNCSALPAPGDQLYVVATSTTASSVVLMAPLGSCNTLANLGSVTVNEVTTIAGAYALSAFASIDKTVGGIDIGAPSVITATATTCNAAGKWQSSGPNTCNYLGLTNAFNTALNLVNVSQGVVWAAPAGATWHAASGSMTATGMTPAYAASTPVQYLNDSTIPTARINALADMLATCVQTLGSGCSGLFSAAATTGVGGVAPADTLQTALNIALNPGNNVGTLLGLVPTSNPPYDTANFVLSGSGAPTDLTLALTFTGAGLGLPPDNTLSDFNLEVAAQAMGIDGAGNIWVGAFIANSNYEANGEMIAKFNSLGAPLTPATTLVGNTPTYGGYNPEPNHTGTGLGGPGITQLTIDQSENLWAYDNTNAMLEISPSLSVTNQFMDSSVTALTIDGSGNAWTVGIPSSELRVVELLSNGSAGVSMLDASIPRASSLAFDSNGGLWAFGRNTHNAADIYQLSASNGSILYDAFPSNTSQEGGTTLVADSVGNIYGCDSSGVSMDVLNNGVLTNSFPITTPRACGNQLVLDGQGHLFAVLDNVSGIPTNDNVIVGIDEFTTVGALLSPMANGFTGSSGTELPTLNPDFSDGFIPTGVGAAIDGSGNLWVLNSTTDGTQQDTFNEQFGNVLIEYIGIGAPVVTPASLALTNGVLGNRP